MQFCLFPIDKIVTKSHFIASEDEDFDESLIPMEIMEGARIENVSSLISTDEFSVHKENLGTHIIEKLEGMNYAIVHRFPEYEMHEHDPDPAKRFVDGSELFERSRNLIAEIGACLRLIRPTPQMAQMCWGHVDDGGKFYRIGFSHRSNTSPCRQISDSFGYVLLIFATLCSMRHYSGKPCTMAHIGNSEWQYICMKQGTFSMGNQKPDSCSGLRRSNHFSRQRVGSIKEGMSRANE